LGPFEIIKSNGKNSFSLKLPNMRVHNSFHVSKLKLSNQNDNNKFPLRELQPPPEPIINEDGESEYEIEKIVDNRKKRNCIEYRVRWKWFDSTKDTWEITSTLSKARDSIKDYLDSLNEQQINYVHSINNKCNRKSQCKNRTRRSEYCQPQLNKLKNLRITNSPYTGTQSNQALSKQKNDYFRGRNLFLSSILIWAPPLFFVFQAIPYFYFTPEPLHLTLPRQVMLHLI